MIQQFLFVLRQSVLIWIWMLAGAGGILVGCSGGGGSNAAGIGGIPGTGNQSPTVTISSPAGTFFEEGEGENIIFSGAGTDVGGGQLKDDALVWTSSIDGAIGTGPTLITSALSAGDHDITLSATDSNGVTRTTDPVLVRVDPTRFLKMGLQTTGVPDASNAFDGFDDTAATLSAAVTEFIHFKAYIGGADTFFFRLKLGASTPGSSLDIEGLAADDTWQFISDIDLVADKIVTVKVVDAQAFKDAAGYINLRVRWLNGQSPDTVPIYELWRVDPVYAENRTAGVINAELAFDGDRSSTFATMATPSSSIVSGNFLYFKAYVGVGATNTFAFNLLLNSIGPGHFLYIYVEDVTSGSWDFVEALPLNTLTARTVLVGDDESSPLNAYLDADGYLNLRAIWLGPTSRSALEIYEIWRIDPFVVGSKTTQYWVADPENAVDGDLDTYAIIFKFWGEFDEFVPDLVHKDFLHLKTYMGDASPIKFSITAARSAPPVAELIVEGEYDPDGWSVIERISLDDIATTTIELPNARDFVDADGNLSLRVRWESDSTGHDAYIYEIRREED
jgi:hypothetical protein